MTRVARLLRLDLRRAAAALAVAVALGAALGAGGAARLADLPAGEDAGLVALYPPAARLVSARYGVVLDLLLLAVAASVGRSLWGGRGARASLRFLASTPCAPSEVAGARWLVAALVLGALPLSLHGTAAAGRLLEGGWPPGLGALAGRALGLDLCAAGVALGLGSGVAPYGRLGWALLGALLVFGASVDGQGVLPNLDQGLGPALATCSIALALGAWLSARWVRRAPRRAGPAEREGLTSAWRLPAGRWIERGATGVLAVSGVACALLTLGATWDVLPGDRQIDGRRSDGRRADGGSGSGSGDWAGSATPPVSGWDVQRARAVVIRYPRQHAELARRLATDAERLRHAVREACGVDAPQEGTRGAPLRIELRPGGAAPLDGRRRWLGSVDAWDDGSPDRDAPDDDARADLVLDARRSAEAARYELARAYAVALLAPSDRSAGEGSSHDPWGVVAAGLARHVALEVTGVDPFPSRFRAAVLHSRRTLRLDELFAPEGLTRRRGPEAAEALGEALVAAIARDDGALPRLAAALRGARPARATAPRQAGEALLAQVALTWREAHERLMGSLEGAVRDDPRAAIPLPRLSAMIEPLRDPSGWRILTIPDVDVPPGWRVVCRARFAGPPLLPWASRAEHPIEARPLGVDDGGCWISFLPGSPLDEVPWLQLGLAPRAVGPLQDPLWEDWLPPRGAP